MNNTLMALKPFIEKIEGYLNPLSKEHLTEIIINLAKGEPTNKRIEFLNRIAKFFPDSEDIELKDTNLTEEIMNEIEALRENMEERVDSIENGSYYDDPDEWETGYYDEEPDYVSEDHLSDLKSLFDTADDLFLKNNLKEAKIVYKALFELVAYINGLDGYVSMSDFEIRESRARYCRCIFEIANEKVRLEELGSAMNLDQFTPHDELEDDPDFPLLQDIIDSRSEMMDGLEDFLPVWEVYLTQKGIGSRSAMLLLEVKNRLYGIKGVAKLAREWKHRQPKGYLYWLSLLKNENDHPEIIIVSLEALKNLTAGKAREKVAEYLTESGEFLNKPEKVLTGKRERFFSNISDQNLLNLVNEANKQGVREAELRKVLDFFKKKDLKNDDFSSLYAKSLLMYPDLETAFSLVKNSKCVGWSYSSSAGIVFGAVNLIFCGYSQKADTVINLMKDYTERRSIYSDRSSFEDEKSTTFYSEINRALNKVKLPVKKITEYFAWAEKIGKERIEHIVSHKHRKSYTKAAEVLGALCEVYISQRKKDNAQKLINLYYNEKFNRYPAFRREVKSVFTNSPLLMESVFL